MVLLRFNVTWFYCGATSHGFIVVQRHMVLLWFNVTWFYCGSTSHGFIAVQRHMALLWFNVTWFYCGSTSHDFIAVQRHMVLLRFNSLSFSCVVKWMLLHISLVKYLFFVSNHGNTQVRYCNTTINSGSPLVLSFASTTKLGSWLLFLPFYMYYSLSLT